MATNDAVIDSAFARLVKREEFAIRNGMYGLLNAGLEYLEQAHGMIHGGERHKEESDTLGWALVHDGQIVEAVSHSGGEWTPNGDALGRLQDVAASSKKGWVGIIMSDMANDWYRVDYEMDYLAYSADEVRANFGRFFKPVSHDYFKTAR